MAVTMTDLDRSPRLLYDQAVVLGLQLVIDGFLIQPRRLQVRAPPILHSPINVIGLGRYSAFFTRVPRRLFAILIMQEGSSRSACLEHDRVMQALRLCAVLP